MIQPPINRVLNMDAMAYLRLLPPGSVNSIITSPPYFGLRDYGVSGQIGLEKTPAEYVSNLVELFREARRVLRDDGTFWLNLGDSYSGATSNHKNNGSFGDTSCISPKTQSGVPMNGRSDRNRALHQAGLVMKNLLMIPARVAIALQDDGWIIRSEIVWAKPNPMPESVTDRPTRSHEMIYLLTKSPQYRYDAEAIKEPAKDWGERDRTNGKYHNEGTGLAPHSGLSGKINQGNRNKRDVWTIPTAQSREAHFATFPRKLIEPMILAGCPAGGIVLDPFMGSGTTALVARELGRNFVGCELNPDYAAMIERRLAESYNLPMLFD